MSSLSQVDQTWPRAWGLQLKYLLFLVFFVRYRNLSVGIHGDVCMACMQGRVECEEPHCSLGAALCEQKYLAAAAFDQYEQRIFREEKKLRARPDFARIDRSLFLASRAARFA